MYNIVGDGMNEFQRLVAMHDVYKSSEIVGPSHYNRTVYLIDG